MFASKIGSLFSSKNDGSGVEKRIIKYLGEENLEWALEFCNLVLENDNYERLRKTLNNIKMNIAASYHEIIIRKLKDDNTSIDNIENFLKSADQIMSKAMAASSISSNLGAGNCCSLKDTEELLKLYYTQRELLEAGDLDLLLLAEQKFIVNVEPFLNNRDSDLVYVFNQEKQNIKLYMLSILNNNIGRIGRKQASLANSVVYNYSRDLAIKIDHKKTRNAYGKYRSFK